MPAGSIDVPRLLRLLAAEETVEDLRTYFAEDADPADRYTGRRFESLAGGGDRSGVAERITADDLVAVMLLSVQVPAAIAIELLDGRLGDELAALLREIPTDVALADDAAGVLVAPGSAADRAWTLLTSCDGVGWVTASKLLARKRPCLVPVYDRVVRCALGRPGRPWTAIRDALRADGHSLERRLHDLHRAARLDPRVRTLRVLDVALWMRHHAAHREYGCDGLASCA